MGQFEKLAALVQAVHPFDAEEPRQDPAARRCVVCRQALAPGQRKVHAGKCARERETQLQQKRRQRGRIARPDAGR